MDCSPPGSSIQTILQARILEWIAIPFSRGSPWARDQTRVSCIAGRFFTVWVTREAQYETAEYLRVKNTDRWGLASIPVLILITINTAIYVITIYPVCVIL